MKDFFRASEVAKMCRVSTGSVIRWVREGKLFTSMTAGGHLRVPTREVVKLLESLKMPVPPELQPSDRNGKSGAKVLIVDDELGVRGLISSVIKTNFPDVQIEEAADGFMAGWKAHAFSPDLVVLDLHLPGIDGFRVCQLIRSFLNEASIRIIAITGMEEADTKEKILKMGADDFLAKPFDAEILQEKMTQYLASSQGNKND